MWLLFLFILLVVALAIWGDDECPRIIYGYNCKGEKCDHSAAAIEEAKATMRSSIWPKF